MAGARGTSGKCHRNPMLFSRDLFKVRGCAVTSESCRRNPTWICYLNHINPMLISLWVYLKHEGMLWRQRTCHRNLMFIFLSERLKARVCRDVRGQESCQLETSDRIAQVWGVRNIIHRTSHVKPLLLLLVKYTTHTPITHIEILEFREFFQYWNSIASPGHGNMDAQLYLLLVPLNHWKKEVTPRYIVEP
jgi:hypothetical protein